MAIRKTTAALTGSGQATPALLVRRGIVSLSVSGTFVGTVSLQRAFVDDEVTWRTVEDFTAPVQKNVEAAEPMLVRLLCSVYVSGTADARLSWG